MSKRSKEIVLQLMEQAHKQGLSVQQIEAQELVTRATVLRWIHETRIGLVDKKLRKNSRVAFVVPSEELPVQASLIDDVSRPTSSSISLSRPDEPTEPTQVHLKIDISKLSKVSGNKSYVFEVLV